MRLESEIDEMKGSRANKKLVILPSILRPLNSVQLLKFESDLNAEKDARRMAENAAEAANSVAQNLLRESHRYITRGLDS